MADWTKLNGVSRRSQLTSTSNDTNDDDDDENNDDELNGSATAAEKDATLGGAARGSFGRQRSPRKDEPIRRSRRDNEELVKILTSDESLVPVSKLGYENNLALVENGGAPSESQPMLQSGSDELEPNDRPKRPSSLYRNELTAKETSREKLVLNGAKPAKSPCDNDASKQHHVQFNRKLLKSQEKQRRVRSSSSSSSSSSEDSSSSSSSSSSGVGSISEARPPDGGWGWVVVAASFMVNLIADGITFSFGVIFHEFLIYFGESKATTSWIGSLFMAMPLLSGPIASFLTDRYGCRKVTIAGSILATTGFVISYFANSMGVLILTFGVLAGFGLSLCFVAAVVIVAYYFDKRRSFATGLSVCGSGIGTFIFPPLIQRLLSEYGWRGTTLILAGLFLNLAVCGCLMRDLEWTTSKARLRKAERRRKRDTRARLIAQHSSSADSFSASSSANTAQTDPKRDQPQAQPNHQHHPDKLFSSLLSLPTFVNNGERVPLEVLELLSARSNMYNVLVHNYPSMLVASRSFSDSSGLHDQTTAAAAAAGHTSPRLQLASSPLATTTTPKRHHQALRSKFDDQVGEDADGANWWLRKVSCPEEAQLRRSSGAEQPGRVASAYLKDIRVHRHSLTYRGAMLNINRYRLRASSCPDIYRNSMTTIAKQKMVWYSGLWEFWDLLLDMLDLSHFADSTFLLFSISNFLLHTWYDVPYMYLTDNAIEIGFSESQASYLISIIGIMNMAGEILLGWAGDKAWVNASLVYAVCMALCGAFTALIPMATQCYSLLSAIAGAFGFFIAANYSLTSIILVEAITLERFTNAYGLLLLVQGIANLMGPPLAGWLYDITGTYDLSFYLAGSFICLSGMMLMVMPLKDIYHRIKKSTKRNRQQQQQQQQRPDIDSV